MEIKKIPKSTIVEIEKISRSKSFQQNPYFYLYDLNSISNKLDLLQKYLPQNISLYYAMKANPNLKILKHISRHQRCNGVEIASAGELEKALKIFKPENICYTGPGKTMFELELSILKEIRLINIESLTEANRLNKLAKKHNKNINILVRINTNFFMNNATANMGGMSTKLGIDEDTIEESIKEIKNLKNLNIEGYHVFSASGIMDYKVLIEYTKYIFTLVKKLEKNTGIKSEIIDFGGGLGVDLSGAGMQFDIKNYGLSLLKIVQDNDFENKELLFELGRYIVSESGYYCSEIIDIKKSKNKKHIILAGGVNHLKRPSISEEFQPIYILKKHTKIIYNTQEKVSNEFVDVGGPLCFHEDMIYPNVKIEEANIGDILITTQAGAYGYSGSPLELLSHKKPPEYIKKDD